MLTMRWLRLGLGLLAAAAVTTSALAASGGGTITTIAGNGSANSLGAVGPAKKVGLNGVTSVAVDARGNVYISESVSARVRKVNARGVISTLAGTGKRVAYPVGPAAGDGGPAAKARFGDTKGVAIDGKGSVYIADQVNRRVRKVSPGGTITTFAGTGQLGSGGDGGPATAAQLNAPTGLAVDRQGNVYIADRNNGRVRKVTPGGTISTVAGVGGVINRPLGDGGPATKAYLTTPEGVAVDSKGNLYIADLSGNRVRKVSPGGTISTVVGGGVIQTRADLAATSARLYPQWVAVDSQGNLYVTDPTRVDGYVWKVNTSGKLVVIAGNGKPGFSGDGGPATKAKVSFLRGIAVDRNGNVYFGDGLRVRKVTKGR
jgi:sugar lactone lactonase YvrE